jgi:toxin YhaV
VFTPPGFIVGVPGIIDGWRVLLHPLCARRYARLLGQAQRLYLTLPSEEYRQHSTVRLAAAVHRLITAIVPADPDAPAFRRGGALASFRCAAGEGLPPGARLCWTFSRQAQAIIFLYLYLYDASDEDTERDDPYTLFKNLAEQGEIGDSFASNLAVWLRAAGPNW